GPRGRVRVRTGGGADNFVGSDGQGRHGRIGIAFGDTPDVSVSLQLERVPGTAGVVQVEQHGRRGLPAVLRVGIAIEAQGQAAAWVAGVLVEERGRVEVLEARRHVCGGRVEARIGREEVEHQQAVLRASIGPERLDSSASAPYPASPASPRPRSTSARPASLRWLKPGTNLYTHPLTMVRSPAISTRASATSREK